MSFYLEYIFISIKCILFISNLLYLIVYCGKTSIENKRCKTKENNVSNKNCCIPSEFEKVNVKTIDRQKSCKDISNKNLSRRQNYTISTSSKSKNQISSSFRSKKNLSRKTISKKEVIKPYKSVKKFMASKKSIKNVGRSIEKSKKTISEENIKPIKFPKILVPVEERIRLPNLSLEQIKNIEKFNVPKADSYFRTEYLTKEPRLVQALDNIQAYLSQRKKLLTY